MEEKPTIFKKILQVRKEIERMSKDGHNDFQNYKYLSETQITLKMKELLDKHGVIFWHDNKITKIRTWKNAKDVVQFMVNVKVDYQFIDVDSGEKISGTVYGQGQDSGDKGIYKAITGAIKYLFMKNFMIPTGDDPENETKKPYSYGRANLPTPPQTKAEEDFINSLPN